MGLISIILLLMAGVGYLTFGFTESVCGKPDDRFHGGAIGDGFIGNSSVVIHGYDYDFSKFHHPVVGGFGEESNNPVLDTAPGGWNAGGNDISFMFQKVNQNCLGVITRAASSSIGGGGNNLDYYFPCNIVGQYGDKKVNSTGYGSGVNCHTSSRAKTAFTKLRAQGQVYYTWNDVHNSKRNLAVYESSVFLLFSNWEHLSDCFWVFQICPRF